MQSFEAKMRQGGRAALQEASRFFMKQESVHQALEKICQHLQALQITYAVIGGAWLR